VASTIVPARQAERDVLDGIAERFIARAAPVRFTRATTDTAWEAIYRLRYEAVVRHGWASPEAFPDGLERDAYDDVAVHVAGWDGERLAATARIVFPTPGLRLPTEEEFALAIESTGQAANVDRLTVAPP